MVQSIAVPAEAHVEESKMQQKQFGFCDDAHLIHTNELTFSLMVSMVIIHTCMFFSLDSLKGETAFHEVNFYGHYCFNRKYDLLLTS